MFSRNLRKSKIIAKLRKTNKFFQLFFSHKRGLTFTQAFLIKRKFLKNNIKSEQQTKPFSLNVIYDLVMIFKEFISKVYLFISKTKEDKKKPDKGKRVCNIFSVSHSINVVSTTTTIPTKEMMCDNVYVGRVLRTAQSRANTLGILCHKKKRGKIKNIKIGGAMWAASLNTLFDKKKTKKNKQKKNKKNYHTLTTTARTIREP